MSKLRTELNSTSALIIFTRNPELGKCKTRLARTIGDKAALNVYNYLLQHTANICKTIEADKYVFYSENIQKEDLWDDNIFNKKQQEGTDLGAKMKNAFSELFQLDYQKVIIVGSDLLDLETAFVELAFKELNNNDVVIGPAEDGGYYLLGLSKMINSIFKNKEWGTNTVLENTAADLENYEIYFLNKLNDIDTFDDLLASKYYQSSKKLQKLVSDIHD